MEDFKEKLKNMKINVTDAEFSKLKEEIDTNKNGYIDFHEFAQIFNHKHIDALAADHTPLITAFPSQDKIKYDKKMSTTTALINHSQIQQNAEYLLKATTRFSATPGMNNTFQHFRDNELNDYTKGLNSKVKFQQNDKMLKQVSAEQRAQQKRDNIKIQEQRIEEARLKKAINDNLRIQARATRIQEYEKSCRIQMEL